MQESQSTVNSSKLHHYSKNAFTDTVYTCVLRIALHFVSNQYVFYEYNLHRNFQNVWKCGKNGACIHFFPFFPKVRWKVPSCSLAIMWVKILVTLSSIFKALMPLIR